MSGRSLLKVSAVAALALHWVGCADTPGERVSGMIVPPQSGLKVGSRAPNARFVDAQGNGFWLSSVYNDATVIAFIDSGCMKDHPELTHAGETLGPRVRIIEICSERCESQTDCVEALQDRSQGMVTLCDGKQVLSRRYGLEDGNGVFVLDRRGVVRERGTLEDLPTLLGSARKVAVAEARMQASMYGGN